MANPDRARKLLMRTALVTSSTIATLIGAQNLAMLDASRWQQSATPSQDTSVLLPVAVTAVPQGTAIAGTEAVAIQQAAPSITILRQPGQVQAASPAQSGGSAPTNHTAQIQPPSPVQLAAPAPQVIQQPQAVYQPVPQQGRSSR